MQELRCYRQQSARDQTKESRLVAWRGCSAAVRGAAEERAGGEGGRGAAPAAPMRPKRVMTPNGTRRAEVERRLPVGLTGEVERGMLRTKSIGCAHPGANPIG